MTIKNHQTGTPIWEWGFLQGYNTMIMLGMIVAFLNVVYFWKRQKYSIDILLNITIIAIPTAILGARFWDMLFNGQEWSQFFKFAGLSIHGGVMFSTLAVFSYVFFQRKKIDLRTTAGMIIPTILIGQAIGRWGNFFNHELYGSPVSGESLNWLTFIKPHMYIDGQYRTPLFFYESMINLLGYLIIVFFFLRKNFLKPGSTSALYFIWYGITRAILNPLRVEEQALRIGNVRISGVVSYLWILFGLILLFFFEFCTNPLYQKNFFKPKINKINVFLSKIFKREIKINKNYTKKKFKKKIKILNWEYEINQIIWLNDYEYKKFFDVQKDKK